MWIGIGFQKTIKTFLQFPALILMPVWTFWMIGPRSQLSILNCRCKLGSNNKKLVVSFFWTWLNACLTILVQLIFFFIIVLPTITVGNKNQNIAIMCSCSVCFLMILSLFLLIALQCLIPACCGKTIQRTVYDPDEVHCITYLE